MADAHNKATARLILAALGGKTANSKKPDSIIVFRYFGRKLLKYDGLN